MKNHSFILLTLIFCVLTGCTHKNVSERFNLDFEKINDSIPFPKDWVFWGHQNTYSFYADSIENFSGNFSASIKSKDSSNTFGSIAYKIPNIYKGKEINLEGYIKTENVSGFAGLLLRLDKKSEVLAFDNMQFQNVKGTNHWKKYSILLPFYDETETIYVGGLLVGEGQAWFDDFTLTIDGKDINTLKQTTKKSEKAKAEHDREFEESSQFEIENITQQQIENLYQLGKTWGYLKYHHPDIAKGKYNWDYELFRILPKIKTERFDKKLNKWASSFGKIKKGDVEDHYYIDFTAGAGNAIFKNEKLYRQMDWEDDGYRLLALFRYWNMIEYFFPYKYLTDKNWDEVLVEYTPKILEADDQLSYKLTLLQLIGEIQDTHANIWQQHNVLDSFFGNRTVPVEIEFIENKALVTKVYDDYKEKKSIVVGTEITAINGKQVAELIEERKPYYPASNSASQLRDMAKKLLRTNEEQLQLTLSNGSTISTKTISTIGIGELYVNSDDTPSYKELHNGEIGYIYPGKLVSGEIDEIMEKFMDKKGIVVDLRCYPSDFIVFSLGKYLMPEPVKFVKFTTTTLERPGEFAFGEPLFVGEENPEYYKGKIAILINETTQSQAEYTTMALRVAPKAKVFGSQTAGADGNVSEIYLPGNIRTMISGIGVYYPDGTETQRIGIVPDVEVKPTIQGIRVGKDEVLEAALDYLNSNSND